MPTFDKYIAIDWSGAKNNRQKGIAVAIYKNNTLKIHNPPNGATNWARTEIYTLIEDEIKGKIKGNRKTLIGIDFAFAFPWCDCNSYFPGHIRTPTDITNLWKLINELCCCNKSFYGGSFFKHDKNLNNTLPLFYEYIMYQCYTGSRYSARKRVTETVCASNPTTVFKFVGSDQVGTGSVAGMRMLYAIRNKYPNCPIWPFDKDWLNNDEYSGPVIVEIYPGFYRKNNTFSYTEKENRTKDERDALISALALRYYATCTKKDYFEPPSMTCCARKYEGWIFGVL